MSHITPYEALIQYRDWLTAQLAYRIENDQKFDDLELALHRLLALIRQVK